MSFIACNVSRAQIWGLLPAGFGFQEAALLSKRKQDFPLLRNDNLCKINIHFTLPTIILCFKFSYYQASLRTVPESNTPFFVLFIRNTEFLFSKKSSGLPETSRLCIIKTVHNRDMKIRDGAPGNKMNKQPETHSEKIPDIITSSE